MSPMPPAPFQTLNDALSALLSLPQGADAWCWMTDRGPGGRAAIVAVAVGADPEGARFREQVRATVEASDALGATASGTVRRLEGGLVLVGDAEPEQALSIHRALCENPLAFGMPDLTVVQMRGDALVSSLRGVNLSEAARVLGALSDRRPRHFYLLHGGELKRPRLVLADDELTLKAMARASRAAAPSAAARIRGQIRLSSKGALIFKTAGPGDLGAMMQALVRWTAAHQQRWPALRAMVGARIVATDERGEVVERYRDDAAWEALA